jgi:hypothetical protein
MKSSTLKMQFFGGGVLETLVWEAATNSKGGHVGAPKMSQPAPYWL